MHHGDLPIMDSLDCSAIRQFGLEYFTKECRQKQKAHTQIGNLCYGINMDEQERFSLLSKIVVSPISGSNLNHYLKILSFPCEMALSRRISTWKDAERVVVDFLFLQKRTLWDC